MSNVIYIADSYPDNLEWRKHNLILETTVKYKSIFHVMIYIFLYDIFKLFNFDLYDFMLCYDYSLKDLSPTFNSMNELEKWWDENYWCVEWT